MITIRRVAVAAALLCLSRVAAAASPASPAAEPVDFRFAPAWWQTAICLPDDPDKLLVGKEGQLLIDFLDRPLRNFGVILQPDLDEGSRWIGQATLSARAPVVVTRKDSAGVEVVEEAFVVTPRTPGWPARARLVRADAQIRVRKEGWARPPAGAAFTWTGADVARDNKPLEFALTVRAGAAMAVAVGLCEGHYAQPGKRLLTLRVEGADPQTIDPVATFGPNVPGVCRFAGRDTDGDGAVAIRIEAAANSPDPKPYVNAVWAFEGEAPSTSDLVRGWGNDHAYAWYPGRPSLPSQAIVLVTLRNGTNVPQTRQPVLRIGGVGRMVEMPGNAVRVGDGTWIGASAPLTITRAANAGTILRAASVSIPPGETRQVAFTIDRNRPDAAAAVSIAEAGALRDAAKNWWEHLDLPYETIAVPDAGLQAVIESCVRNIWQAREQRGGRPAFHVGPTVYRGLWVVDGAFLLETATLLGRAADARSGIEHLLSHQRPDGSFEIIRTYWKENGIVLWAATRHAMLTQDKAWLHAHWPALRRVVAAIEKLQTVASADPNALDSGLLPPGYVDGGISNKDADPRPEFSNAYWCLAGLKSAIAAAQWLGDTESVSEWQPKYDAFLTSLTRAMRRDAREDPHGNQYVPTMMANAGNLPPAKGQWAFCQAVYPGQVFPMHDPLVQGQLAMLAATKVEGMVCDTGWMKDGLWTYFASFYGHAQLWEGHGADASRSLYDFAQHAAPTRVWREEQKPLGRGTDEVGDMPHNWASAEFVRLAAHLIEFDRGDELHLLEGFPREWAAAGKVTRLNGVATPFGALTLEVRMADDGGSARVRVRKLTGRAPTKIVLHLDGLAGEARAVELPIDRDTDVRLPLSSPVR